MALSILRASALAAATWTFILAALPCGARAELELSVLSYNVRGLSWLLARDDPGRRSRAIGELLGGYDVVLLQENFEYSSRLEAGLPDHAVVHGNAMRPDPRLILSQLLLLPFLVLAPDFSGPYGSGLTTAAGLPVARRSIVKQPYRRCEGWFGGRSDCWASKGFLRVRLEAGVDVYNTHLDSGGDEAARRVRASQLDELATAIERDSTERAVVVGGDFNLPADRPADRRVLETFQERLGLRDTGAGPEHHPWRRLDYLFVRSGPQTAIRVLAAGEDHRFAVEATPLSDHPPIFARLAVAPAAPASASP